MAICLGVVHCGTPPEKIPTTPAGPNPLGVLVERQGNIRVLLTDFLGARAYELSCPSGLRYRNPGDPHFSVYPFPTPIQASFAPSNALHEFWRLIIATYSIDQRSHAERRVESIRQEYGVRAEIIEDPARDPWEARKRTPDAKLMVAVGRFATEEQARKATELFPEFSNARIFKDVKRGIIGSILLHDRSGNLIGQMLPEGEIRPLKGSGAITIRPVLDDFASPLPGEGSFRGAIQLLPEADGSLLPINIVHVEDYLLSVVPGEIGDFAPEQALKAQAVAARSEAICKLNWGNRHADSRYDFITGQQDQVYPGVVEETDRCTQAIRQTHGQVLLHNNKIIDAVYSHSCGGRTADSEDIWPGVPVPYLRGKPDYMNWLWPFDLASLDSARLWTRSSVWTYCNPGQGNFPEYAKKFYRWTKDVPLRDIARRVNDRGHAIGNLKSIRVTERAASGHVKEIELVGDSRTIRLTNGDTISYLMGDLYSSYFVFEGLYTNARLTAYRFQGTGFGHGVGLCQIGAYMMAKRGYDYADILQHYFTDVELHILY